MKFILGHASQLNWVTPCWYYETNFLCQKILSRGSMWNSIAIHDHWGFTCESSCETPCEVYVKICVNLHVSSMWNSRSFAIQWGLNACESPCETPFEVYVKICVNLHVSSMWNSFPIQWGFTCESLCETLCEVYVKICVKGLTSFHTLFTYISLCKISHACEISVWNSCEKCVKNVWKECENWTIFTRFFTWCFTYILLVV